MRWLLMLGIGVVGYVLLRKESTNSTANGGALPVSYDMSGIGAAADRLLQAFQVAGCPGLSPSLVRDFQTAYNDLASAKPGAAMLREDGVYDLATAQALAAFAGSWTPAPQLLTCASGVLAHPQSGGLALASSSRAASLAQPFHHW